MITFHYTLCGPPRYGEYLLISILHLMHRGGVDPRQIMVSAQSHYCQVNLTLVRLLRDLGVDLVVYDSYLMTKALFIDERFLRGYDVVQIDCDCVYMGDEPIIPWVEGVIEQMKEGNQKIALWKQDTPIPVQDYRNRKSLLVESMRNSFAYNKFLYQNRVVEYLFEEWIKEHGWILGGLAIYRKELHNTNPWDTIMNFAFVSSCDETPIQVARYVDCLEVKLLNDNTVKHLVSPKRLDMENTQPLTFVHFAGDHYRIQNKDNQKYIHETYIRTLRSLL